MTIKQKISYLYFGITFGILILFSFGTYAIMRNLLLNEIDNELEIVIDLIEESYNPNEDNFTESGFPKENSSRYDKYFLILYNTANRPVYKSLPAKNFKFKSTMISEDNSGQTINLSLNDSVQRQKETAFRIMNEELFYNDKNVGRLTIGISIESIEKSMSNLVISLTIAIFVVMIVVVFIGYVFTKRSLKPIADITKRARHISSTNLNERIEIKNMDELGELSSVLNDLLERLEKAFKNQQEFIADATHELKTPLAILRTHWEEELNNPALPLEIKKKMVHDIETISRLTHLINNLLLLSKSELINSGFKFECTDLSVIVKEVFNDLKFMAENKEQKIVIAEIDEATISGDKMRLYQLFFNLIDNAIRYTPNKGSILIALRIEKNNVLFEVTNSGSGIAEEEQENIFQRFYRLQKDRARKTGGSGLGLSICKLIADLHNGTIKVKSKINSDTTFQVLLPLKNNS